MEEGNTEMDIDNIKIGDRLQIHCYKHDGSLHRKWDEPEFDTYSSQKY